MNKYFCSNGDKVTQSQIDTRLKNCYINLMYDSSRLPYCAGCHGQATCHAHIIPKARAKQLRKTELIWTKENIFYSCIDCNSIAENVSSEAIRKLKNFEYIKHYMSIHDVERFNKMMYGRD